MCVSEVVAKVAEHDVLIPGGAETPYGAAAMPLCRGWYRAGLDLVRSDSSRAGIVALASQSIVSITTFVTSVLVGRACSKAELGLYTLGFTVVVFVIGLQASLISLPYMIHSPRLKGRARAEYAGSTLIHQFVLSLVVIVALIIGAISATLGAGPENLSSVLVVLTVVIVFISLKEYARQICFANLRVASALALDTTVAVIQIGGLLLLAYLAVLSAGNAYWIVGCACAVAAVAWCILNRKNFVLELDRAATDFTRNWSFGKWIAASGLLWMGVTTVYPWFLVGMLSMEAVGVWAVCIGVVGLGNPVLLGLNNFFGPKLAHCYARGGVLALRPFVLKASLVQAAIMAPLCIFLVVCGGLLVVVFYGSKYSGNGLVVALFAFNLLVTAANFCVSRALFAMDRAKVDFAINAVVVGLLLTAGLWLISSFDLPGAASALLLANLLSLAARCVSFAGLTCNAQPG